MSVLSNKTWIGALTVILSIHCTIPPSEPSDTVSNGDNDTSKASTDDNAESESNAAETSSEESMASVSKSDSGESASETATDSTTDSSESEESSASESNTESSTTSTSDSETETTADDSTDNSSDSEESATDSSTDSSSDTTDGTSRYRVEGVVRRVVEPFAGNDGIGMLYTSLQKTCGDASTTIASFKAMADLSTSSSEVPFLFEDIPDGTWYVSGFLDDDENADTSAPAPSKGDIVAAEGAGPGCVEVVVSGADAENAVLELNLALPF